MDPQGYVRKYLSISSISLLGSCETKFYDAMFKPRVVTTAMKTGIVEHEKLTEKLPKISKGEMISSIKSGAKCSFREVSVFDRKLKLAGRYRPGNKQKKQGF